MCAGRHLVVSALWLWATLPIKGWSSALQGDATSLPLKMTVQKKKVINVGKNVEKL